jgi:hypothetical protein
MRRETPPIKRMFDGSSRLIFARLSVNRKGPFTWKWSPVNSSVIGHGTVDLPNLHSAGPLLAGASSHS